LFGFEFLEKPVSQGFADEQRAVNAQIGEPFSALCDFLRRKIKITEMMQNFSAMLERQPISLFNESTSRPFFPKTPRRPRLSTKTRRVSLRLRRFAGGFFD
jgi:hypothetical protein